MFQTMYLWTVPFSILLFASHWLPLHRACLWAAIIVLCLQQPVCAPGSMKYLPPCFPGDSFFAALTVHCLCSTSSCVSSCGCCMSCTKFIKVLNEDYFTICLFVLFMHCIEDWFDVLQNLDFQNSRMSSFLWKPPSRHHLTGPSSWRSLCMLSDSSVVLCPCAVFSRASQSHP